MNCNENLCFFFRIAQNGAKVVLSKSWNHEVTSGYCNHTIFNFGTSMVSVPYLKRGNMGRNCLYQLLLMSDFVEETRGVNYYHDIL